MHKEVHRKLINTSVVSKTNALSKPIEWGQNNEERVYKTYMKRNGHDNLEVKRGFIIHPHCRRNQMLIDLTVADEEYQMCRVVEVMHSA